jgi:hypothetical protein
VADLRDSLLKRGWDGDAESVPAVPTPRAQATSTGHPTPGRDTVIRRGGDLKPPISPHLISAAMPAGEPRPNGGHRLTDWSTNRHREHGRPDAAS